MDQIEWYIGLILSGALLLGTVALQIFCASSRGKRAGINVIRWSMVGIFLSGICMFLPVYWDSFDGTAFRLVNTLIMSVHNTIRLFVVDSDFEIMFATTSDLPSLLKSSYQFVSASLYLSAPILTFGFVLSFFKNFTALLKYYVGFRKDIYAFSELNDASVTLAEDIRSQDSGCMILFTDVYANKGSEEMSELIDRAGRAGAILFPSDIVGLRFDRHSKKAKIKLFLIGESDDENVRQYTFLYNAYRDRALTDIYLFSMSAQSELALALAEKHTIKVHRVNESLSLIYSYLYEKGHEVFERTHAQKNGKKVISVVVVGLGKYGTTVLKTLAWFGQMTGYYLKITAITEKPNAESLFAATCPELMDPQYNAQDIEGEAQYDIKIIGGVRTDTDEFIKALKGIPDASFAITCLGNDDANIQCALTMRTVFERMNIKPFVKAIVRLRNQSFLNGAKNFKGQDYDIDIFGDVSTLYSAKVILHSDLERDALSRHLLYGSEEDFWRYEYNYRSSCASALHHRVRVYCGIPGAGKPESELTPEEALCIKTLEHKRWNAYMRSEGYVYSGSKERSSRNDLGKMHNDLVCYGYLDPEEQEKDLVSDLPDPEN